MAASPKVRLYIADKIGFPTAIYGVYIESNIPSAHHILVDIVSKYLSPWSDKDIFQEAVKT